MITRELIENVVQQKYPNYQITDEAYIILVNYQRTNRCSNEQIIQNIKKILDHPEKNTDLSVFLS